MKLKRYLMMGMICGWLLKSAFAQQAQSSLPTFCNQPNLTTQQRYECTFQYTAVNQAFPSEYNGAKDFFMEVESCLTDGDTDLALDKINVLRYWFADRVLMDQAWSAYWEVIENYKDLILNSDRFTYLYLGTLARWHAAEGPLPPAEQIEDAGLKQLVQQYAQTFQANRFSYHGSGIFWQNDANGHVQPTSWLLVIRRAIRDALQSAKTDFEARQQQGESPQDPIAPVEQSLWNTTYTWDQRISRYPTDARPHLMFEILARAGLGQPVKQQLAMLLSQEFIQIKDRLRQTFHFDMGSTDIALQVRPRQSGDAAITNVQRMNALHGYIYWKAEKHAKWLPFILHQLVENYHHAVDQLEAAEDASALVREQFIQSDMQTLLRNSPNLIGSDGKLRISINLADGFQRVTSPVYAVEETKDHFAFVTKKTCQPLPMGGVWREGACSCRIEVPKDFLRLSSDPASWEYNHLVELHVNEDLYRHPKIELSLELPNNAQRVSMTYRSYGEDADASVVPQTPFSLLTASEMWLGDTSHLSDKDIKLTVFKFGMVHYTQNMKIPANQVRLMMNFTVFIRQLYGMFMHSRKGVYRQRLNAAQQNRSINPAQRMMLGLRLDANTPQSTPFNLESTMFGSSEDVQSGLSLLEGGYWFATE